jgi:hypothetical protein
MAPKVVVVAEQGALYASGEALAWLTEALKLDVGGHNVAYDMACVMRTWPELTDAIFGAYVDGRVHDTMLLAQLHDIATIGNINGEYSLAALAKRFLKLELVKGEDTWRLRYAELDGVPLDLWPQAAKDYALADADVTQQLADILPRSWAGGADEARAAFWLRLCTNNGLRTDGAAIDALASRFAAQLELDCSVIEAAGLLVKGVKRTKLAQQRLEAYGVEVPRTPTGKPQLTPESVAGLNDPTLESFVRYGRASGVVKALDKLRAGAGDVPIHPEYRSLLVTGRAASGGGQAGINIQNLRREEGFRECFVADPGCALVSVDYAQLELCTLAQACYSLFGQSRLRERINAGEDVHLSMAKLIAPEDPKKYRTLAKCCSFGYPGGLGEDKFIFWARTAYGVRIEPSVWSTKQREGFTWIPQEWLPKSVRPEQTIEPLPWWKAPDMKQPLHLTHDLPGLYCKTLSAGHLRSLWLQADPVMKDFFAYVSQRCKAGGTIQLPSLGRVRGRCNYGEACNYFFQGTAAVGAKRAGFELTRRMHADRSSAMCGGRVLAFVHDEVIAQFRLEQLDAAAREMAAVMCEVMQSITPDVTIRAEPAAMLRWTKKAEAVYDQNGRLIPWSTNS